MKKLIAILAGVVIGGACFAQDEEAITGYTYATYLMCDTTNEKEMDAYVEEVQVPVMDKLVDDGVMPRWGYLRHHTGGEWRRIVWFGADSVEGALAALESMGEALEEAAPDGGPAVCGSHVDYIWQQEARSSGDDRGAASMSVYYNCKITKEARADEIFKEHFAPVLDDMVEDGKLASWGWQSHVVGGWFRRLQTLTAADYPTLLAARQEALDTIYAEGDELGEEFAAICGPHHDYLWDIVHENMGD